ncbi:MAG: proton-conducting transporter membrane subunit [Candidatus Micrarchaeaceae archaeon]
MLTLYVILPFIFAAAAALAMADRVRLSAYIKHISLAASIAALLIALSLALGPHTVSTFDWFSAGSFHFSIATATYPLNLVLLLLVAVITPFIFLYSYGFMPVPSEQSRYYFLMNIFAASMMLFAISYSFITLFIAWELLGITSYLLIGFWYKKEKPGPAARKAITTIIIGDVLMLAAIIMIFVKYGSLLFSAILSQGSSPILSLSLVLIAIAAFTKSAQFPFNEWIAGAMEGPTPVSAFLHSSTMVKAGVFMIAVLLPLYSESSLLYIFIAFGVVTALLGALNALSERHIKRILAYSTTEDLGLMFVALGFGSLLAAMMLFVVQAFYKALLLMSAGSIMSANKTDQLHESFNLQKNKLLLISTAIGVASIAGIFPLSGFFGKVLVDQTVSNIYVYVLLAGIEFISVLYIFRWFFVPMHKAAQDLGAEVNIGYRTLPKSMLLATALLAALVLLAGAAFYYLPRYLGVQAASISITVALVESLIIIAGFAIAYIAFYRERIPAPLRSEHASMAIYTARYVNSFYNSLSNYFLALGHAFYSIEDGVFYTFREGAESFILLGKLFKRLENGNANFYMAVFAIGLILIALAFYAVHV